MQLGVPGCELCVIFYCIDMNVAAVVALEWVFFQMIYYHMCSIQLTLCLFIDTHNCHLIIWQHEERVATL